MTVPAVIARGDNDGIPAMIATAIDGELIIARGNHLTEALQTAFEGGRPIVTNVAAPIVIRTLAPLLQGKYQDPPVVVTGYDGKFVVPLLGLSHGATEIAIRIAEELGWTRVSFGGTSQFTGNAGPLDNEPEGYSLQNPEHYKDFAAAVLDGATVRIEGNAPWLGKVPQAEESALKITVTDRDVTGSPGHLVFTAQTLALGVGCERGAGAEEIQELVSAILRENGLAKAAIACFATIDLKEDEPGILALTDHERLCFFTAEELQALSGRIENPSDVVLAEVGTASVAEAAALAAAGPDSQLIVAKRKSRHATCAIARAPSPILKRRGRARGHLGIVGLGPGAPALRSPAASAALRDATDWVGYSLYLDLAEEELRGQKRHDFPLGGEEERCRKAIALAKEGKRVALLCSGDAGIYAMAALVYELIDREPCRIAVEVHPGISAFQAASAKAGAMIGHDFCCISLSDLLTPWATIERRLKAAAEGDFVISFYNPRSLKRHDQIERAFEILKPHRRPDTPVVIASSLGRPEEQVRIVRLDEFNPADVDMLTLVMVGSTQSKAIRRGDGRAYAYTPRGYAKKMDRA